jgi:hypothetical protein
MSAMPSACPSRRAVLANQSRLPSRLKVGVKLN